jgi:hypothetical protein
MAPGQDGNSDTKERVPRDALFLFVPGVAGAGRILRSAPGRRAFAKALRRP